MTRKEKRLEVVKDVLKQLKYLKVSTAGTYLWAPSDCNINQEDNLKDKMSELKKCEVCAKGALFIGHVDKFNKLSLKDLGTDIEDLNYEETLVQPLLSYFSQEQLDMIECAFELDCYVNDLEKRKENVVDKCIRFGERFSNPKLRLRRILENILENDGLFQP